MSFVALMLATTLAGASAVADEPADHAADAVAASELGASDALAGDGAQAASDADPADGSLAGQLSLELPLASALGADEPDGSDAPATLAGYLAGGMLRVSADVALAAEGEDVEPVVGSFTVDGLTYAVTGEGEATLVAVSPRTLAGGLAGGSDAALDGGSAGVPSGEGSGSGVPPRSEAEQVPSGATSPSPSPEGTSSDEVEGAAPASVDTDVAGPAGEPAALAIPDSVEHGGVAYAVTAIGPRALAGCDAGTVVLPASVASVDQAAFDGSSVASIEVAEGNPSYSSYDGMLFDADMTCLLLIPEGKQGAARIPSRAEEVDAHALSHSGGVSAFSVGAGCAAFYSENGSLYDASGTLLWAPPGSEEAAALAAGAEGGLDGAGAIGDDASEGSDDLPAASLGEAAASRGSYDFTLVAQEGVELAKTNSKGTTHNTLATPHTIACGAASHVTNVQWVSTASNGYVLKLWHSDTPEYFKWLRPGYVLTGIKVVEARNTIIGGSVASETITVGTSKVSGSLKGCLRRVEPLWAQVSYSVTLSDNFSGGSSRSVSGVKVGSAMPSVTPPTRAGYRFAGYTRYSSGSGTRYYDESGRSVHDWDLAPSGTPSISTAQDSGYTLYAQWVPAVTLHANGHALKYARNVRAADGSASVSGWTEVGARSTASLPFEKAYIWEGGTRLVVDEPSSMSSHGAWYNGFNGTEAGYSLAGWATSASATTPLKHPWSSTSPGLALYAVWEANSYTVKFNANGGSGGQAKDVSATYGSAMPAISATKPTKAGHSFGGWYDTSASTGGTQYYTAEGKSARAWDKTATTTLYARWAANAYDVSFSANGGSGGQSAKVKATYGSIVPPISATKPTRAGYTFMGWYDNADYAKGTQYYTANAKGLRNWDKASNGTLYAGWKGNEYSVTLDQQGGSGGTVSAKPTYGSAMPAVTPPTRAGYAFNGYFDQKNGKGTQYYTWEGKSARSWDKAGNATLYAKWTKCGPRVRVHVPAKSIWRLFAFDGVYREGEPAEYKWDSWRPDACFNGLRYCNGSVEVDSLATSDAGGGGRQFGYKWGVNDKIAGVTSAWVVAEQADGSRRAFALGSTTSWTDITGYAAVDVYLNRAVTYAVTWDANGGSVSPAKTEGVLPYASAAGAPLPVREGYSFTGWFTAKDGGDYVCGSGGSTGPIGGNVTYYAHWANQGPGVTLHAASAPIYTYECYDSYDEAKRKGPMSKTNPYGPGMWVNDIRLSGGTLQLWGGFTWKEGAGWIDAGVDELAKGVGSAWAVVEEQDGSKRGLRLGGSWTSVLPYKSVHVYLNDCAVTSTVTWDANGGTIPQANGTFAPTAFTAGVMPYATVAAPSPVAPREGLKFVGWWTDREGGDPVCQGGKATPPIPGDVTYYAQWLEEGAVVTYHASSELFFGHTLSLGVTWESTGEPPYAYGDRVGLVRLADGRVDSCGPSYNSDRRIDIWFALNSSRQGVESAWLVAEMPDGSKRGSWLGGEWTSLAGAASADAYLNGAGASTVTWDGNGGMLPGPDGSLAPTAETAGVMPYDVARDAPEPKRYGYAFAGWYTAADGGDYVCGAGGSTGQVSSDATYYAHWALVTDVEVPIALGSVSFEVGVPDGSVRVAGTDGGDGWAEGWLRSSMPVEVAVDAIRCEPADGFPSTDAEAFWAGHAGYVDVLLRAGEREGADGGAEAPPGSSAPLAGSVEVSLGRSLEAASQPGGVIEGFSIPAVSSDDQVTMARAGELPVLYGLSVARLLADTAQGGAGVDVMDLLPDSAGPSYAALSPVLKVVFTVDATRYA